MDPQSLSASRHIPGRVREASSIGEPEGASGYVEDLDIEGEEQDIDYDRHIDGEDHDIDYDRLGLRFGPWPKDLWAHQRKFGRLGRRPPNRPPN